MRLHIATALYLTASAAYAEAPKSTAAVNSTSPQMSAMYNRIKKFILDSAEAMPEKEYSFKPSPDIRSFGQLVGHVADAQYMFCSAVKHEPQPKREIEKTATTKAALTKALSEAFAYCDPVYAGNTDASLSQAVELFGGRRGPFTKFLALNFNIAHDNEHYGNMVTYMRLKKIVPPSTAGGT
jgi:uncharacterized damage-inducible protein DinB